MIQEIKPKVFHNEYKVLKPKHGDIVFAFSERTVLCRIDGEDELEGIKGQVSCPVVSERMSGKLMYIFRIDEKSFFLWTGINRLELPGYSYQNVTVFRRTDPQDLCYAGMTAFHLYVWHRDNHFCGRCGTETVLYDRERALCCPKCGNIIYPKICPAIIVGITNGDKIIITRYKGREYKGVALVAGYCEIGESAEATVKREVMEEVGLEVENIHYYKSQPWGFDGGILLGFFCSVVGNTTITREEDELAIAEWVSRNELNIPAGNLSLTNNMICLFKDHPETIEQLSSD